MYFSLPPISKDKNICSYKISQNSSPFQMECGAEGGLCGKLAIFGGKLKRTSRFHNPRPQWKVKWDVALTDLKDMFRNCYQSGSNEAAVLFRRARKSRQVFWNLIIGLIIMLMLVKLYNFLLINKIKHFLEFLFILVVYRNVCCFRISWLEHLVTEVAGHQDSIQMLCFDVVSNVCMLGFFPTNIANI